MARILSYGKGSGSEKNSSKGNPLKSVWTSFQSLDKFVKFFILTALLIIAATPFITSQYLNYLQYAASQPSGSVETEDAALNDNVSIGSDTNASGGNYIEFGTSEITGTTSAVLNPGDGLLLKQGRTWSDTLTSGRDGTSFQNIIVGTYL